MTTKHSADDDLVFDAQWPLSNDPNDPNKAYNRTRYVVNGRLQCPACKEWKHLEDYHKAKNMQFGVCGICKECAKKRRREHYYKSKVNSPYRDENGNIERATGKFYKRYKHKEHRTPKHMRKNYEIKVWLFTNKYGHIQYHVGAFKTKEEAEQFVQEIVDEQEVIIANTKNKHIIKRAQKEIAKWRGYLLLKFALRKLITNKDTGEEEG